MTRNATAAAPAGCRVLEWDSEFFGITIANVEAAALAADGAAIAAWCAANVDCAYLLAEAADQQAIDTAQVYGFRQVDIRVTLEKSTTAPAPSAGSAVIRGYQPADLDRLKGIARSSHRDTRFYVDGRFDHARCDEMYDVWITKSCNGWADHVLVAEVDGGAAGYVTCHRRDDHGEIGLVGVAPEHRGAGIGTALTGAALDWSHANGMSRVSVVTQGRNAAGMRLYQHAGFIVRALQLWFHKWR